MVQLYKKFVIIEQPLDPANVFKQGKSLNYIHITELKTCWFDMSYITTESTEQFRITAFVK